MEQKSFKKEQVVEIVKTLSQRISNTHSVDEKLLDEVNTLKELLESLQSELNLSHSDEIQVHIPEAKDHLDAVIEMTESATHTIIESCEVIQEKLQDKNDEESRAIESQLIRIIEACTFQDVTGQRLTKIIKTLRQIDEHASRLSEVINQTFPDLAKKKSKTTKSDDSDGLLNGPALAGEGISQEEIDRLLADF